MKNKFCVVCLAVLAGLGIIWSKPSWADSFAWNFESVSTVNLYYSPSTGKQELMIAGKVEGVNNPFMQGFTLVDLDPNDVRQKSVEEICEKFAMMAMGNPAKFQFTTTFQADHPVSDSPRPSFVKGNSMNCGIRTK